MAPREMFRHNQGPGTFIAVSGNRALPSGTLRRFGISDAGFRAHSKLQTIDNQSVGRVWSFRGVTARNQAEIISQRLAAIVDSSDDAIVGKDLNSIVTSWNAGAERIFGYSASEMIGTSIMRLIPPDHQEEEEQILSRIRSGHRCPLKTSALGKMAGCSMFRSPFRR